MGIAEALVVSTSLVLIFVMLIVAIVELNK